MEQKKKNTKIQIFIQSKGFILPLSSFSKFIEELKKRSIERIVLKSCILLKTTQIIMITIDVETPEKNELEDLNSSPNNIPLLWLKDVVSKKELKEAKNIEHVTQALINAGGKELKKALLQI